MKLLIFLLFIPLFSVGQGYGSYGYSATSGTFYNDSIRSDSIWKKAAFSPLMADYRMTEMTPSNKITFYNKTKSFSIDFSGDSLIVSGDLKPNEQAKVFIDYCRVYMRLKIDSLEQEVKFERSRFEALSKAVEKITNHLK